MKYIILLGDSIFDNRSYVNGGKDTLANLREQMPVDWKATLLAVDGSIADSVAKQLPNVPADATHLFVSVGGNDALGEMGILQMRASSAAEVFKELSNVGARFEKRYKRMLDAVLELNKPTAVCTIYYPRYPDARMQKIAVAALSSFNDVITRQAFLAGLPLIDLRYVCDEDADYANPIEPSVAGGAKIARTIITVANEPRYDANKTSVYLGSGTGKHDVTKVTVRPIENDASLKGTNTLDITEAERKEIRPMRLSEVESVGGWFDEVVNAVKAERERRKAAESDSDSFLSGLLSKMLFHIEGLNVFIDFDFEAWTEDARMYTEDVDKLLGADLLTLRQLLSYYRHKSGAPFPLSFNNEYWGELAMNGQLLRILKCFQNCYRDIAARTSVSDLEKSARS